MKNKRVEFRISEKDFLDLKENMPSDFENLSEFLRGAALYVANNPGVINSVPVKSESNLEDLEEIKQDIIGEIQKNRTLIMNLIHATEGSKQRESKKIRDHLIQDLLQWYVEHQDSIRIFDDLYDQVDDPFLREVIPDAIQLLKRRGTISISNTGKVVWHD